MDKATSLNAWHTPPSDKDAKATGVPATYYSVEFADVGGGNGGVATGVGLGFLVSASIGGIDKSGVVVAVAFSNAFGLVKGSPLDDFVVVFGTSNTYYISAGAYSRNTGTYTLTAIVTGSGASITPSLSDDYIYDANGNMTKNNNKIIQWTSFNKPKRFTKNDPSP
jgi:hypothetical protein